mmetsp:Transcript_4058/g.10209  ORF Transcript_4058/g.10209 Transcript_4058/m.10209 type:complete len:289 (+) Transcript_4058:63-929(+)
MSRRLSSKASGFGAEGGSGATAVSIWSLSKRCHGCSRSAYVRGLRFGRRRRGFRGDAPPKTDLRESSPLSGWTVPKTDAKESCGSKCDAPPSSAFSRLEPSFAVGVGGGRGFGGDGAGLEWAAAQVAWAASSRNTAAFCLIEATNVESRGCRDATLGRLSSKAVGFLAGFDVVYVGSWTFSLLFRGSASAFNTLRLRRRRSAAFKPLRSPLTSFSSCSRSSSKPASFWALRSFVVARYRALLADKSACTSLQFWQTAHLSHLLTRSSPIFWARRSSKMRNAPIALCTS